MSITLDYNNMLAPRLGVTWDYFGDGTLKLFAKEPRTFTGRELIDVLLLGLGERLEQGRCHLGVFFEDLLLHPTGTLLALHSGRREQ